MFLKKLLTLNLTISLQINVSDHVYIFEKYNNLDSDHIRLTWPKNMIHIKH